MEAARRAGGAGECKHDETRGRGDERRDRETVQCVRPPNTQTPRLPPRVCRFSTLGNKVRMVYDLKLRHSFVVTIAGSHSLLALGVRGLTDDAVGHPVAGSNSIDPQQAVARAQKNAFHVDQVVACMVKRARGFWWDSTVRSRNGGHATVCTKQQRSSALCGNAPQHSARSAL